MGVVQWNGDMIAAHIRETSAAAIDEITEASAQEAVVDRWWIGRGAEGLVSEIVTQPATVTAGGAAGRFGTTRKRGFYGLFLEYERPFLRPVADRTFPLLADRLQEML